MYLVSIAKSLDSNIVVLMSISVYRGFYFLVDPGDDKAILDITKGAA